ncbi:L,D-transpeptidase family protein [Clostridium sp.]|uniref:L,D-transpeptidase family protein n=1 Tax=Clostridium sp. TaxID=1506 RepID=UPI002622B8E1|nr:L,D-transpeptidase family protein [Clostridium sp.]
MDTNENKINKFIRGAITSLIMMFALFLVFSINTIGVSAKTTSDSSAQNYTLSLKERGGLVEKIKGSDINLKYGSNSSNDVSYDDNLLQECINKLSCFDSNNVILSQNAKLIYENNNFVIYKEVYGNQVNRDILYKNIINAIKNKDSKLDLEEIKCYEDPKYVSDSPEVISAKDTIDKYMSSKITYNYAGQIQVLDGSTIKDWINIDGNYNISINASIVRNYVNKMADNYTSLMGTSISVSGGYEGNNHSWVIDSAGETNALIENIKSGQTITKHPLYVQTSAASYFSNVGDSFIEIDMTKQHLWFYKNGYLVVDGDVVTGNESAGNSTPTGVYNIYAMQKDTVLRGEDYAAPVSFWMPFNKNIGLHDASWRSEFGGQIYKTDGSHGCVNAPYSVAKTVYDNAWTGIPVICYYS